MGSPWERETGPAGWGERSGGGRDTQRKKQTPNSLFSLSNSNHREGEDGGIGEWRKGRKSEKWGATWDGLREIHTHSCLRLKFDTENETIWRESFFVRLKTSGLPLEPLKSHFQNFSISVHLLWNNSIRAKLRLLFFHLWCKHLNQLILLDLKGSSCQNLLCCVTKEMQVYLRNTCWHCWEDQSLDF